MYIQPSSIINNYDDISQLCKATGEPVFLEKSSGERELVVLSAASYKMFEDYKFHMGVVNKLKRCENERKNSIKQYTSIDDLESSLNDIFDLFNGEVDE